MKKPNLQTVPTTVAKPVKEEKAVTPASAKASNPKSRKVEKSESEKVVKRSFSIQPAQNDYIEQYALDEGQKRGKSMNASEALRQIINKARGL